VAQVAEIVDRLPRIDIPGDQVHFVVEAKKALLCRAAVHARSGCDH